MLRASTEQGQSSIDDHGPDPLPVIYDDPNRVRFPSGPEFSQGGTPKAFGKNAYAGPPCRPTDRPTISIAIAARKTSVARRSSGDTWQRVQYARALAAGCNDVVSKPYSPRQLLAKIRKFLP